MPLYYFCIPDYAWKTIAKIATDVITKMQILVSSLYNQKLLSKLSCFR